MSETTTDGGGARATIGLTGLAVMGRNLARNIARHGHPIAVHNRTTSRMTALLDEFGDEGDLVGWESLEDLVAAIERPRVVVVMVKAGEATDAVVDELVPLLDEGDVVVDAGNAHVDDTLRRQQALEEHGLHFVGMGVSGGEEGALHGPSIMVGGSDHAYERLGPVMESVAAHVDGTPCCAHVGAGAAGHFVKMVHNGIEYADMQLIAESYDLLRSVAGLEPTEVADVFEDWNAGDLESFLIEMTADVLRHTDAATGRPLVDVVRDEAEQKGTGRWTVQSALDLGVPVTGIAEATFARSLSGHRAQREAAREVFSTSPDGHRVEVDRDTFVDQVRAALYASKVVAYAQGSDQVAVGAEAHGWEVDLGLLLLAGLLRRPAPREAARRAGSGPARQLRGPHLPAARPRGHLPHPLGRRPRRGGGVRRRAGERRDRARRSRVGPMSESNRGPSSEPTGSPTGQSARPVPTSAVTPAETVPTPQEPREGAQGGGKGGKGGKGERGDKDPLRGSRTSGVWVALTAAGLLLVLLVVFTLQNTQQVGIAFLGWEGELPLSAAILIAAAAGILITALAGSLRILQLRRRVKHHR